MSRSKSQSSQSSDSNGKEYVMPEATVNIETASQRLYKLVRQKLVDLVWPSEILNHLDPISLQMVFRTWLCMWVVMLLQICPLTDVFMGPSSFLAVFSSGIEISGGQSITMAFVGAMIDLIGVMFPFACMIVSSAINWRLRGYPTYQELMTDLMAEGICTTENFDCFLEQVHHGRYLSTRTTTVTIFAMLFALTICGSFQTRHPMCALPWLLSSLATIIFGSFLNMYPLFDPWYYGRNTVVPLGISFAARFFFSLIVFPTTSSAKFVRTMANVVSKVAATERELRVRQHTIKPSDPGFVEQFAFVYDATQACQMDIARAELDGLASRFEVAFTRLDEGELGELRSRVRLVVTSLAGLSAFYKGVDVGVKHPTPTKLAEDEPQLGVLRPKPKWVHDRLTRTYKASGKFEISQYPNLSGKGPAIDVKTLNEHYEAVVSHYATLVEAAGAATEAIAAWITETNKFRTWSLIWRPYYRSCERNQKWHAEQIEVAASTVNQALKDILPGQDSETIFAKQDALYGFSARHFAKRVVELAHHCLVIDRAQPRPKWIFPWTKSRADQPRFEQEYVLTGAFDLNAPNQPVTSFEPLAQVQPRDPDSSPPRNVLHLIGLFVLKHVIGVIHDSEFLFNIRRSGLIVVALIPYFCRTTIHVSYSQWWMWSSVLTAYTVSRHAVDGIYGLLAKLLFCFLGSLVGMCAWYISAGRGEHASNHYGYAAVMAAVYMFVAFHRHFNTHTTAGTSVVFTTTCIVITGNSWNSTHTTLSGVDLGSGFHPAWVRFVTVTIGISISFVGTIFPYPYTAKRVVREITGQCFERLGNIQAQISNFSVRRFKDPSTHITPRDDYIASQLRATLSNLASAERLRKRLAFEPPMGGVYPRYRYKYLIRYGSDLVHLYSLLHYLIDEIADQKRIPDLLRFIGWTKPELTVGVYSIMYMQCRALIDAKPLPSITPGFLAATYAKFPAANRPPVLMDHDSQLVLSAAALAAMIYERIDFSMILTKALVGEVYDVDIDVYDLESMPSYSES